jgi:DNA-binding response OmpR family regulator
MISGSPPTVLLVEDDHDQAVILRQHLRQHGLHAQHAQSLQAARQFLSHTQPDLILLDLNLADGNGRQLLEELRAGTGPDCAPTHAKAKRPAPIPVVVLSAVGQQAAHARALHEGADDFIVKPYHLQLLLARITAVLRRVAAQQDSLREDSVDNKIQQGSLYYFGDFVFDTLRQELRKTAPEKSGLENKVNLTPTLFALLKAFVSHPNQLLSRDQLAAICQGRDYQINTRSIDMQVAQLRKRIEANPRQPVYLHTRWGKGYVFTPAGVSALPPPEQQSLPLGQ